MDPKAIAAALKTALEAIDGFTVYEFIPSQPMPPSIWVYPEDISYHPATTDTWMVQAVVSTNLLEQPAQETLKRLLGTGDGSVLQAVEADGSLGGTVDDVIVTESKGFQVFELPTLGLTLGSTWTLGILTTDH